MKNESKNNVRRRALAAKMDELAGLNWRPEELNIATMPDDLDRVMSLLDRDFAVTRLDENARLLREVRGALLNLESGEYGICQSCDEPIAERRLDAVPWARLCVSCQTQEEALARHAGAAEEEEQELVAA